MLLKQIFRTYEGALKRATFENAHSTKWAYRVLRFYNNKLDTEPFHVSKWGAYTWCVERTPHRASVMKRLDEGGTLNEWSE